MGSGHLGRTPFFISPLLSPAPSLFFPKRSITIEWMALPGWLKESVRPYYLRWLYFRLFPSRRPAGFRDCWQYPYRRLVLEDPLFAGDSKASYLVFYPMTDWHTRIQRSQHLARTFARSGWRCLYLSPHLGREFESVRRFDPSHRLSQLEENVWELHIRLPREPVFHQRLLTAGEEAIVMDAVSRVIPAGARRVVQMVSFPLWWPVARRLRQVSGFPILYDCHDLLSGFGNVGADLLAAEAPLIDGADLVLFSSLGLMEHFPGVPNRLLVRNGVTAREFANVPAVASAVPVVGYLGALDSWFDIEAVEQAAAAHPQCRFVLAGRVEFEPIRRLERISNVELLGEVPYDRVPGLLASFQVGLIPFRINPLTLMTNPIKLYEYFSRGIPVVSAPLPEACAMGDLVYLGADPTEFSRAVSQAVREDDPARRARRREIAEHESWESRALEIMARTESLLPPSPLAG